MLSYIWAVLYMPPFFTVIVHVLLQMVVCAVPPIPHRRFVISALPSSVFYREAAIVVIFSQHYHRRYCRYHRRYVVPALPSPLHYRRYVIATLPSSFRFRGVTLSVTFSWRDVNDIVTTATIVARGFLARVSLIRESSKLHTRCICHRRGSASLVGNRWVSL